MLWLVEGRKLGSKTFNREIAILKTIKSLAANFKNWMKFWSHKDFFLALNIGGFC